ncbi:hypothetical protein U0070_017635 [Myodes glareolus]|uniref:Uncharacterized protein n=1 Tax=Myodes glareolus TaxID=447135 RepID=A0AAW0K7I7_MYOGA
MGHRLLVEAAEVTPTTQVDDEHKIPRFDKKHMTTEHKRRCLVLKKQCTKKNKERAAEDAELLIKRMKKNTFPFLLGLCFLSNLRRVLSFAIIA